MFNIGFAELVVISALALLIIGPKQLPEVAKVVARLLNEFKRATEDLTGSLADTKKQTQDEINKATVNILEAANSADEEESYDNHSEIEEETEHKGDDNV